MKPYFLTAVSVAALFAGGAQADTVLHILHTNDIHSRIEPVNQYDSTCATEDDAAGECFGGIARVASKINELRDRITAEGGNVIVLDAGDQYQGSLFYTTYKGKEVVEFMNAIGYDAMAIGNHEFDDGNEGLNVLLEGAEFPILSSNLDLSQSEMLRGKVHRSVVLEVGDQRIGLVSALTRDTLEIASPGDDVIFTSEAEGVRAGIDELTAQGIDKIIALTHIGYHQDQQLAAEVDGLDAIIGGHSHTLLGDMEGASGPYPTMVGDVPVVQAYAYSKYLGHLILTFDDAGNVTDIAGQPILLDASVSPEPDIAARIAEMSAPIEALRQRVVAEIAAPVSGDRDVCRARECEMGTLVTEAMLDRVRDQGVSIAIVNGGGLRASIDAGPVTMDEIYTVLPFQNTLATFQLRGDHVIAALENGASQYEEGAGRFAQVAGLRYTVDPGAAPGERISDVMVERDGEWVPIDPEAIYGVASNNYMRAGGDGYSVFAQYAENAYDFGPDLAEVLADYLAAQNPDFVPVLDGRITVR